MFRKDRIFELAGEEARAMAEAGEVEVVYSPNHSRSGAFSLHPEMMGVPESPSLYTDLGDEVWLERRRPATTSPTPPAPRARPKSLRL
jgi:hypothetical protein